jgi:hypothetical protein
MGRPLNKKYFGNRNLGSSSTTADDKLGGKRVASITIDTPGSYTTATTVTIAAPDLAGAGAVQATGTIVYEALSATVSGTMVGYSVGDLLTVTTAGGSAIAYVATIGGTGGDDVLTVNFTGTGASRGSFTSLEAGAQATTTSDGGTGCTLTVTYRVKSITITEPGSGYTDAADAAVTFGAGAAAGTAVLETDSGAAGAYGNNENAIVTYAYLTGGSLLRSDIVKQTNDRRYKVENATSTGICQLKTSALANAAGEMNIVATDTDGGTYFVAKLTSRKAVLVPAAVARLSSSAGSQFASGASAKWTFGSAVLNTTVTIENA